MVAHPCCILTTHIKVEIVHNTLLCNTLPHCYTSPHSRVKSLGQHQGFGKEALNQKEKPVHTCGWHRLLAADMSQLSARLMVMRLAAQSTDVNVLKIVEDHPCLLLQETFALDSQAS